MIHDGLWDPYGDVHMGNCAELCAREYALRPRGAGRVRRARATAAPARRTESGRFGAEIVAVEIAAEEGRADARRARRGAASSRTSRKMGGLKPAFEKDGTVTAANA